MLQKVEIHCAEMHYAIIANPTSGTTSIDQKRLALSKPAEILNARIYGLESMTPDEFVDRAREVATCCEVLVVAGGDGTLSDIINSVDISQTKIAYLPMGTGNSMRYALRYEGALTDIAATIKNGRIRRYDLINCDEKRRAITVSIGIEAAAIRLRDEYLARGNSYGFKTYLKAVLNAYFGEYRRVGATITIDDATFQVKDLLTLMIVKQPYYGFGMKVVPDARLDDRQLHILTINSGILKCALGAATAFTIGNRIGSYRSGRRVTVQLEKPLAMQMDGNLGWVSDTFTFSVLPNALRIKH
ncbi:MAG: hypothetical protein KJ573_05310 [Proteobacteria bacterium]|nr:hypothetical protein [Pseudomonadota bacterium]MBU1902992.1 hypothetical protein [Pseudomonadota bacterium]